LSELWDDVAKPLMVQIGGFLFFHNLAVTVGEHQPGLSRGFVPSGILVPSGVVNDAQQRIATPVRKSIRRLPAEFRTIVPPTNRSSAGTDSFGGVRYTNLAHSGLFLTTGAHARGVMGKMDDDQP
jgi:hypothetical protein